MLFVGCQDKLTHDWTINVYPNPHAGGFTVRYNGTMPPTVTAQLMTASGQVLQEREIVATGPFGEPQYYEVSSAAAHTYIITLSSENTVLAQATTTFAKQ